MPERTGWIGPALILTAAVTALRVIVLWFDQKQLFVDEAQYWLWGQDLAWGYYSKPPLIGWVIRAATELAGSDAPFWVRLPSPLLHAATALLLGAVAERLWSARVAIWTVAVYLSLPLITVGSLLMTTDTVMFPFLVLALLAWLRAIDERSAGWAALAGASLGVGLLGKYAALYYAGAAALTAALVPRYRPSGAAALVAGAAFLLVISPNLVWNVGNGLVTLQHTAGNIDWAVDPADRIGLELTSLAEFTAAQFAVFGPIFLAVLAWLGATWRRRSAEIRLLLLFSLPIILLIVGQSAVSRAYANWAAPAYLAGSVVVAAHMWTRARGWLIAGLTINVALAVAIPIPVVAPQAMPDAVRRATMDRYLGRAELSREIIAAAEAQGVGTVVSGNRDVLADLFYTGRDSPLAFRAVPREGPPRHHYAMTFPYEGGDAPVLYAGAADQPPACVGEEPPLQTLAPPTGYWADRERGLWVVPGDCWARS